MCVYEHELSIDKVFRDVETSHLSHAGNFKCIFPESSLWFIGVSFLFLLYSYFRHKKSNFEVCN